LKFRPEHEKKRRGFGFGTEAQLKKRSPPFPVRRGGKVFDRAAKMRTGGKSPFGCEKKRAPNVFFARGKPEKKTPAGWKRGKFVYHVSYTIKKKGCIEVSG